jgi:hypothetical protein
VAKGDGNGVACDARRHAELGVVGRADEVHLKGVRECVAGGSDESSGRCVGDLRGG